MKTKRKQRYIGVFLFLLLFWPYGVLEHVPRQARVAANQQVVVRFECDALAST